MNLSFDTPAGEQFEPATLDDGWSELDALEA